MHPMIAVLIVFAVLGVGFLVIYQVAKWHDEKDD